MTWKVLEINCTTGEQIERDPTDEEIAQKAIDEKLVADQLKKEAAMQKAKSELLERLGITEEEAKLLLS